MPKRGYLEESLSILTALNQARVRHDGTRVDALQADLAIHDARCGYLPKPDPTKPMQHGERVRAGKSRAWWSDYAKRNATP